MNHRWHLFLIYAALGGAAFPAVARAETYYLSPSGQDSASGLSETEAWATFVHANTVLEPGDTLLLADGTYDQQLRPEVSGSDGAPITFRALNDFKAVIAPTTDTGEAALYVRSRAASLGILGYLSFEGLIVRGVGENPAVTIHTLDDDAPESEMTHHITIKKLGAFGSQQETNGSVISLGNGLRDSLVEDVFAYGRGRKAGQAFGCIRITVRRGVWRYDYWEGDDYKPNDPRTTFSGYNTQDSIFENLIAVDAALPPAGYSSDNAAFSASGNETPAGVSGSARNQYVGIVVLNTPANGVEVNGGSGAPNESLTFKDIFIWNSHTGTGFNVQGNDNGSSFSFLTIGNSAQSGFRLDPYPHQPITNESVTNVFSIGNGSLGFVQSDSQVSVFENNTGTNNGAQDDLEPNLAPDISMRLLDPITEPGRERGASIVNRYVDGTLTDAPLWPWPFEDLIKEHMCNRDDLNEVHRWDTNDPLFVGRPGLCESSQSLTEYIWQANGATCPADICTGGTGGSAGSGGSGSGGSGASAGSGGTSGSSAGSSGAAGGTDGVAPNTSADSQDDGCGCRLVSTCPIKAGSAWLLLLVTATTALRRSRRYP